MKKKYFPIILLFTTLIFVTMSTPSLVFANESRPFTLELKIENPLKVESIQEAVRLGLNGLMMIAIPVIIVMFIWAGFRFVLALGNEKKLTEAKNNLLYTAIGAVLVLGAWTIASAIITTVNSLKQ